MKRRQVIVIGGGAAGLMAAGQAAQMGAKTLLLEKKSQPGRKLLITGKGRCNLTNIAPLSDFITHFGTNGRFLRQAFARFFSPDLIEFFRSLGVWTVTEEGGRVEDVVKAMLNWIGECGVIVRTQSPVRRLLVEGGRVLGVEVSGISSLKKKKPDNYSSRTDVYLADAVLIATGGASYPETGSTGDGFRLADSAGHNIIPIRPALVPLETAGKIASRLQGLSLQNVKVKILIQGKKRGEARGEMLFAHFGVSGPMILSISRLVVDALQQKQKVDLSIDLMPDLDERELNLRLLDDLKAHGKRKFGTFLGGLLPRKLIPVCADLTDISPDKLGHQITAEERRQLKTWLKDFRLEITGHRPLKEAMITAGGVDTKEIDPRTMESRLVKGLYFAGEVLDLDADTGGYNLQAAFSTGWLAGRSAAGLNKISQKK
jgi:predicted Rossmann fold flavoprotein